MHNNEISSQEISELISPAHNDKFQVMLNNKVMNEYLAKNQSKIRCPFCDQIFDVNVQASEANSAVISSEPAPKPSVKCPNVSPLGSHHFTPL